MEYVLFYLIGISFFAVLVTCADKFQAINNGQRVPEKTLFVLSILGGSVAMFVTMLIIRHKTKKKRFMLGIPFIVVLQVAVLLLYSNINVFA